MKDKHIGRTFNDGKLTCIRKVNSGTHTKDATYEFLCRECAKDPELYGDGVFMSSVYNVSIGHIPCGCAPSHRHEEWQNEIIAKRALSSVGLEFVRFSNPESTMTRRKAWCICKKHGLVEKRISHAKDGSGCVKCANETRAKSKTKTIDHINRLVDDFVKNNDSKYKVISVNHNGGIKFASVTRLCDEHGEFETLVYNMVKKGCGCQRCGGTGFDMSAPAEMYVCIWRGEGIEFVKFGITNKTHHSRVTKQKYMSGLDYELVMTKKFAVGGDAQRIEQRIKKQIGRRAVEKDVMPDGYTETCSIEHLDFVIAEINKGA